MLNHDQLRKKLSYKKNNLNKLSKIDHHIFIEALKIREIQKHIVSVYRSDLKMKCPIHLSFGQELPSVILNKKIGLKDFVFCHHRSHSHFLSKTSEIKKFYAELMGKFSGANRGFAGSQDISLNKKNFHAGAILGGSIGIAVGSAFSNKLKKEKKISVAVFGEGAAQQGLFWESINYASLNKLPIIFFCENNKYATYSDYKENFLNKSLSKIVSEFKLKTLVASTYDLNDLKKKIFQSVKLARKNIPVFLEILTYRYNAHVGTDDNDYIANYRNKEEISFWKKHDLLDIYKKKYNPNLNIFRKKIDKIYQQLKKEKEKKISNWNNFNYSNENNNIFNQIKIRVSKIKTKSARITLPDPY